MKMGIGARLSGCALGVAAGLLSQPGAAKADEGKLLATGGVSQVEGAGGGGLATWALITGYETRDGIGLTAHATYVPLSDYSLYSPGVAVGFYNRLELSYASQFFDTRSGLAPLLGTGYTIRQDTFGAKLRVYGDAVYDQNSLIPQISVGIQYKSDDGDDHRLIRTLGARSTEGTDIYVAASKLFLSHSLLLNATVRLTKANQFGILGFGGASDGFGTRSDDSYHAEFEGSAALLLSRRFVVGAEYRSLPNNGIVADYAAEQRAYDVFAAYFVSKNVSLTAGYVDLGVIPTLIPAGDGPLGLRRSSQRGAYLSLQFSY